MASAHEVYSEYLKCFAIKSVKKSFNTKSVQIYFTASKMNCIGFLPLFSNIDFATMIWSLKNVLYSKRQSFCFRSMPLISKDLMTTI